MAYNPGVTNRSGEIFAQYLSQGIGSIADGINKMTKERDDRAKQDTSLTKYAEASGLAEPNELAGMSLEQKQGLVEGRVAKMRMGQQQAQAQMQQLQLQQQQGDQTIMQRLTQPQVPAPGAPTMAGAQNLGMVSPDAAAQGIPAMSAAGFRMLSEGRYNQLSSAYERPSAALSAVQAMNMGGNVDQAIQQPDVAPQMDATTAMRFGRQAGLPIADQLSISRENLLAAKASRDLRTASSPEQVDTFALPNGQSAVALRGSKQLNVLADPNAPLATEQFSDSGGNMHTIIRNPKTGSPMFVPTVNTAQAQKLNVDSLVEAEKATAVLDQQIENWHSDVANNKLDPKKYRAPDPAVLKDLQTRRKRLQGAIDSAADAPAEPAGKSTAEPATSAAANPAATVPADVQALYDGANAAMAKGANRAQVTARLNQELKKKGFGVRE